jgi:hypothetical protein
MQTPTRSLVDDYVDRLHAELADLPPARRHELVEEIEDHIAEALASTGDASEAELRTLLDRLGDPADIAAEARERLDYVPPPPAPRRRLEFIALVMLLPGGLLLVGVGWLVGIVLVWLSDLWDTRDKLVATLIPPFGGGGVLLASAIWGMNTDGGGYSATGATILTVIVILLFLSPFVSTGYLAWRLRQIRLAGLAR